jgi:hypothetical protein
MDFDITVLMARQTVKSRIRKKPGPKPTGKGEPVLVRLQPDLLKPLDHWIADQPTPKPSRPDAVRKALTDWLIGLGMLPIEPSSDHQISESADMAGRTLDALADPSASLDDRAQRKRQLVKGPKELRDRQSAKGMHKR